MRKKTVTPPQFQCIPVFDRNCDSPKLK